MGNQHQYRKITHAFPLGILIAVSGLSIFKSLTIAQEISPQWVPLFSNLVTADLSLIGILLLFGVFIALVTQRVFKFLLTATFVFLVLLFLIDTILVLALDERLTWYDLFRYLAEFPVILSFFRGEAIILVVLFIISWFIFIPLSKTAHRALITVAILLIFSVTMTSPAAIVPEKYTFSILQQLLFNPTQLFNRDKFRYPEQKRSYYLSQYAFTNQASIPHGKPNIILLIVESLSSINSKKISGQFDLLPQFDKLARNGHLFINFFANHSASEGGIISLLGGFPPLHYPTASEYMFEEFANQGSIIGEYRRQGYFTEFLTTADLSFIGLDHYLNGLGINRARGRDEVQAFREADRVVQDAPPDDLLYHESIAVIKNRSQHQFPYLLTLATVSSHLPYNHPEGKANTAESVWSWVQVQLLRFYKDLELSGFFERGILIITGDHRQMRPVTDIERERYGDGARARIPLLIIGKGISRNVIDKRLFQQADLLRKLGLIDNRKVELSPYPIWVERYNRLYGHIGNTDQFTAFDYKSQGRIGYKGVFSGGQITWIAEKPLFARSAESRIHIQRATHQFTRKKSTSICLPNTKINPHRPTEEHSLILSMFDQGDLNPGLEGSKSRLRSQHQVAAINPDSLHYLKPKLDGNSVLRFTGSVSIDQPGKYWFRIKSADISCLIINNQVIIEQNGGPEEHIGIKLSEGLHSLELRSSIGTDQNFPVLEWIVPGYQHWIWQPLPASRFYHPTI